MSQENVEFLRRAYEALNDGDPYVFLEHYDPNILLWVWPGFPESGCFLGAASVERYFAELFAPFGGSFRVEPEEFIEVGGFSGRPDHRPAVGRRSGAEVGGWRHPLIYTLRAGKIIRIDVHAGRTDALEAVGLSE